MPLRFAPIVVATAIACLATCWLAVSRLPAEEPPLPSDRPKVLDDGLSSAAFYLLDEDGNRVMMPGMSLEELERLQKLDEGYSQPTRPFSFKSVKIEGTAEENRADLKVTVQLRVDPVPGGSVRIPLRMGNFHLIAPADVSGVEESRTDFDPATSSHTLWVQADKPRDVEVSMRVVSLIKNEGRSSIDFQLPASPTTVSLDVNGTDLVATTEGRGDEVVRAMEQTAQKTRLMVESSGSDFQLIWGQANQAERAGQVLEAKSRWALRWLSIEDKPTASVDLTVTNQRGDLTPFELELPPDVRLLEQLGSEIVPTGKGTVIDGGQRLRVIPGNTVASDEIKLQFEIEFTNDTLNAETPLRLRGIHVVGAVSQGGEVEIRSDEDYRLRWLRRPWVRNLVSESRSANDPTLYRFSFDRVPFELPIWLAARQRRLQVDPQFEIRIRQTLAELTAVVQIGGATTDGRSMPIDMRGWKVQSFETETTGEPLDSLVEGTVEEVDLSSLDGAGSEETALVLKAVRPIAADENRIELPLPHILADDDSMLIQPGQLTVRTEPGLTLVVDLGDSTNVDEQPLYQDADANDPTLRFNVQTLAADAKLVGFLENDRPRVTLQASASVAIEEGNLLTIVDWNLRPQRGLAGKIPLAMSAADGWENWSVTVNERPAVIRPNEDGQVFLLSDQLSGDMHQVRFRNQRPLDPQTTLPTTLEVMLPRPGIADLSTLGEVPITLRGSTAIEVDTDVAGRSVSELTLDALPSRPLEIRLRRRAMQQQRLVMSRVMLTTQCGRSSCYERLLAMVSGSGTLTIPLSSDMRNLTVDLKVDDQPQPTVRTADGSLSIALAADKPQHTVDLQIWFGRESSSLGSEIRPAIGLPVGVGQVYWNIVMPADQHVVWASPTLGRAMDWQFDRWRIRRVPTETEPKLAEWAGGDPREQATIGNRYLFIGTDAAALRTVSFGRSVIWAIVGSVVLLVSTLLVSVRGARHPLAVIFAAVALCGLTLLAPDAAVLIGQLTLLALSLVAVMLGVRAALRTRPHERILDSSKPISREGSTRTLTAGAAAGNAPPAPTGSTRTRSVPLAAHLGDES